MRIIHSAGDKKKEGEGEGSFLLADGTGGYLCLANQAQNKSNYEGWLTFNQENWTLYKTIENIYLPDKEVNTIHNKFSHVERDSGPVTERFYLNKDAILYEVFNYEGFVNIDFDFRHIYDFREAGRIYDVYTREGGLLIIKYTKYKDNSLRLKEHERYMAIKNVKDYWMTGEWKEKHYTYDALRNSRADFYIYGTLKIRMPKNSKLVFAHAATEEEAVDKANMAWHNAHEIKVEAESSAHNELMHESLEMNAAVNSLKSLEVSLGECEKCWGVFAGYPWFFQFWRRDEFISVRALMLLHEDILVKHILMNELHRVREDGWMENKNVEADLESADATGWLFTRFHDFLLELDNRKEVFDHFTTEELRDVKQVLDDAVHRIMEYHAEDGLIVNGQLETWMDTFADHDYREGARIEIQALQLRMYQFAIYLSKKLGEDASHYEHLMKEFRETVVDKFYRDGKLADGFDGKADMTQRPNIFLAYYIYADLLSEEQWKKVFDSALRELWLDWGGLASISKSHPLYRPNYTGESNESYHRGDSWYFINNIAAICMHRLDKKYRNKVKSIREASEEEMLFSGFLGHCSEISPASQRKSRGCGCQAWSAATLIELMDEFR